MKKGLKILLIVVIIIVSMLATYFVSYKIDEIHRGKGHAEIKVTFDDTETYIIPSTKKLTKEEALKEWPYMWSVENTGNKLGLFQMYLEDIESSTIKRNDLEYALYLDDELIQEGKLDSLNNNLLYTDEVKEKTTKRYKLYIWTITTQEEKAKYEYKITFNAIDSGGPGF